MNKSVIRPRAGRANLLATLLLGVGSLATSLGAGYLNHADLTARTRKLATDHPELVRVESLAISAGRREVWRLELGAKAGPGVTNWPAMLVVAGAEGHDLAGSVIVLAWAESLLTEAATHEAVRRLLERTTIHLVPRLNVDAAEAYFDKPKLERAGTLSPVDDDRDGLVDEDAPEDLNADGLITAMRVQDPDGEFILDATEPRLLVKADRAKGERGAWRLLTEGTDNDQDEQWNEDGVGGVNFNRNFPYGYKFFEAASGRHPVSEVETRALADFVVSHPSIGIVFTFGAADTLSQPPKAEPGGKRPPTALHEGDLPILRELGKAWREALGLKKELPGAAEAGTFSDWVYYHRGRLSLAARPWSPALQMELVKAKGGEEAKGEKDAKTESSTATEKKDQPEPEAAAAPAPPADEPAAGRARGGGRRGGGDRPPAAKPPTESRTEEDRAWLKWVDENAPAAFVAWQEITHPDFPGRKVEVGGHAPFARSNPPEKLLDDLAAREAKFLTDLAGKLPRIGFRKAEAKHLGNSVYEITIQVENNGYLPTALAQGRVSNEVYPTRLLLDLEEQAFLAGSRRTMLGTIEGSGGRSETRLILRAKGRNAIQAEVVSMLGGSAKTTIQLPEAK